MNLKDDTSPQNTEEKPCRACTDFKEWTENRRHENRSTFERGFSPVLDASDNSSDFRQCPLNRDDLGRKTWGFLHTMAAYYPDSPTPKQKKDIETFFKLFSEFYPCVDCAEDLRRQIERFPPKTESQYELSQWLCRVHNRINLRLGKPMFDCAKVDERWRDGWADGSCD